MQAVSRRYILCCLILLTSAWSLYALLHQTSFTPRSIFVNWGLRVPSTDVGAQRPPTWTTIRKAEIDLPQHNLALPFPEGKTGRYVKFSNTWRSIGWNNVNHDMLLNAYLAYESGRTYVFEDYVWHPSHYPWHIFPKFRPLHPHTPLSALLAGPISGGPWHSNDSTHPRSISESWFDVVCPSSKRIKISVAAVKPSIQHLTGAEQLSHWKALLSSSDERCIEIMPVKETAEIRAQTFDMGLIGSPRVLSLWEGFVDSPVSKELKTSAVVEKAVKTNIALLTGDSSGIMGDPFGRMMVVHVRKGDFLEHCKTLANGKHNFFGWSQHPSLPDPLTEADTSSLDNFLRRCLPTTSELINKILQSHSDYHSTAPSSASTIDTLYLMTNEPGGPWLDDLTAGLSTTFERIITNWDLELDAEGTEVSIEVDLEIGASARVFVGNGWSSVSSTMVYRRHLRGHSMGTTRFF